MYIGMGRCVRVDVYLGMCVRVGVYIGMGRCVRVDVYLGMGM